MRFVGFSLMEIVLVLAFLGVMATLFLSVSMDFSGRYTHETVREEILSGLREAQIRALYGVDDVSWGVRVHADQMMLFAGESFAERNSEKDFVTALSGSFFEKEILFGFEKNTGRAIQFGILSDEESQKFPFVISVSSQGVIDWYRERSRP